MKTNYDSLLPQGVLFNLREIESFGIIKIDMMKKLVLKKQIEFALIAATKKAVQFAEKNIVTSRLRNDSNELEAINGKMICLSYLYLKNGILRMRT